MTWLSGWQWKEGHGRSQWVRPVEQNGDVNQSKDEDVRQQKLWLWNPDVLSPVKHGYAKQQTASVLANENRDVNKPKQDVHLHNVNSIKMGLQ